MRGQLVNFTPNATDHLFFEKEKKLLYTNIICLHGKICTICTIPRGSVF